MALTKIATDIIETSIAVANLTVSSVVANGSVGTAGQVLKTGGSGEDVYWDGVLPSRATFSNTTSSIANGAIGNIMLGGYRGYALYKLETSGAAWVRLYANSSSRTADANRTEGTDPSSSAGVIAEIITTGATTVPFAPAVFGFNDETSPTNAIPVAVMNKTGSTGTVTVTATVLRIEE